MLAHVLGGPRWSFTVHGPEEFDKAPLIGLAEKIKRCAFVAAISSYGRSQLYRLVPHDAVAQGQGGAVRAGRRLLRRAPRPRPGGAAARVRGPALRAEGAAAADRGRATCWRERGTDFELVLAGDGEMRPAIEAAIARAGLGARVRITGWIGSAAGARGDPGLPRAGAAELRRRPAGGAHGGHGARAGP